MYGLLCAYAYQLDADVGEEDREEGSEDGAKPLWRKAAMRGVGADSRGMEADAQDGGDTNQHKERQYDRLDHGQRELILAHEEHADQIDDHLDGHDDTGHDPDGDLRAEGVEIGARRQGLGRRA